MIELGLQRISRLLARTPLPWQAIHVAGTNGKGSICAYISSMLDAYNRSAIRVQAQDTVLRHGRFTSPHLIDRWDCITIDSKTVPYSIFRVVEQNVLERNKKDSIKASEFELLTATAFEIFTREKIDVGVVEVGMGGRLDATNIIGQTEGLGDISDIPSFRPQPLVTAFGSIGLDHREHLGDTLEAIAKEKAGIQKPGVPVFWHPSNTGRIEQILYDKAVQNGYHPGSSKSNAEDGLHSPNILRLAEHLSCLSNGPAAHRERKFLLGMPSHMLGNLSVAFQATWTALQGLGRLPVRGSGYGRAKLQRKMLTAAHSTQFAGRQQLFSIKHLTGRRKRVLLDGAHNHQSAQALVRAVDVLRNEHERHRSVTWVLAASSSKDVGELLSPLIQAGDAVFAVKFGPVDGMPWVKPAAASKIVDAAKAAVTEPGSLYTEAFGSNLQAALEAASRRAADGPLVIAGSLYLVGDVLRLKRDVKL